MIQTPTLREDIKPLTGIRGVAAFMIVLYHLHFNPSFADDYFPFIHKAYLSVDLFFVLSGFVLALRYRAWFATGITTASVGAFMVQRIGRIYPPYILATAIYFTKWLVNLRGERVIDFHSYDIVANVLLIQAWGIGAKTICGPSWSVSVELFAYLLFPVLIFSLLARGYVRAGLLGLASIAGIVMVAASPLGVNGALDVVDYKSVLPLLRCIAEFSLGLIAYELAKRKIGVRIWSNFWFTPIILAALVSAFALGLSDLWIAFLFPPLILSLYYNGTIGRLLFGNPLAHWLGVISYSMYLLHPFFREAAGHTMTLASHHFGAAPHYLFVILALAGAIGGAALFQRYVELPGRRNVEKIVLKLFPRLPLRPKT